MSAIQALFASVLLSAAAAAASPANLGLPAARRAPRNLLVSITPDPAPKTVQFDNSTRLKSPDIAADDPRITKKAPGCVEAEQVSLTYWTPTSVLVSWATCDAQVGSKVAPPATPSGSDVNEVVYYKLQGGGGGKGDEKNGKNDNGSGGGKGPESTAKGVVTSYVNDYSSVNQSSYASPRLHHVLLQGLEPGASYGYRLRGEGPGATPREFNFTMPKGSFPFRLGVIADPGQTYNTSKVLEILIVSKPQMVVLSGDFCYADNWLNQTTELPKELSYKFTYQPKWDTWARLFEPLLSHVPFVHTNGNHEVEPRPDGTRNAAYNARYPVPMDKSAGPTSFPPVSKSNPYTNLYYSVELPGVFKYISLTSYAPNQTFVASSDQQYGWFENELKQVDRSKTPWLLVTFHAPWYNTYKGHYKENDCMRASYEPLLARYGVDVVFSGHVHAYERTKPVVNYEVSECGPMYITVGDGGNIEGLYKDFIDTTTPAQPEFCSNPYVFKQFPVYQPQACISFQNGTYCPTSQPAWSAYREPSFGHGVLDFKSDKEAEWTWNKVDWPGGAVPADKVTIIRGGDNKKGCAARADN